MIKGATLSECGEYRYGLRRTWDKQGKHLCYVMLQPSTADAQNDDATIRVCMARARQLGYGGIFVANLFALRSVNPRSLYTTAYPVSEPSMWFKNDVYIRTLTRASAMVICAWGKHGALQKRGENVLAMLRKDGTILYAIKLNNDGSPAHPLYISYDQQPFVF